MNKPTLNHFYWVIAYMAIALFGFADSAYLTASHYLGSLPVCTALEGCDEVALSEYAMIGPVPTALLGSLFYMGLLVIGIFWFDTKKTFLFRYLPFVTVPAFLFSMWLVYVMFFVIDALCIYCLMSAGSTTLIMLLSIRFRRTLLY